jgi:multiple sugar transport system substrate-binding protein
MKKVTILGFIFVLLANFSAFAAESQPQITILINDSPWFAGFDALVTKYMQETGNKVELNVTPFPGMLQKSRNAVQAKESEYDILNLNESWYMQFYANKFVTPVKDIDPDFQLDPNIIEYEWATRWDEAVQDSTKNGELYGFPINGNIQLYFYRKDIFEEKGLSVPNTWVEVVEVAKALHNPPRMFGFAARTAPPWFELLSYFKSYGGDVFFRDKETGELVVNAHDEKTLEALKLWLTLCQQYGPANYAEIGQAEMLALMLSGRLAQVHMVCAAAPNFDDEKKSAVIGKVGAAVVPGTSPENRVPMSGIWVMGIPHNLPMERKKAALAFLEWALSKEAQMYYAKAGAIPVRQDVYEELANDPKLGWWMGAMAESTPYIRGLHRLTETPLIYEIVDRNIREAVIDKLSPEEALWNIAQETHNILVEAGYKVKPLER